MRMNKTRFAPIENQKITNYFGVGLGYKPCPNLMQMRSSTSRNACVDTLIWATKCRHEPVPITFEYEWPPSIKSPNDTELLHIRRSTVEEDPQRIPIYGTKGGTRLNYKRAWLSSSKESSLILLGETLSNSTLKFHFSNRHWLKHRSKSHRVPHSGLCFADLSVEAN